MMIPMIRVAILLFVFVHFNAAINTITMAKEECRKRIAECTMSDGASTPVCGSDGVTYSSHCRVISKQCQGMSILIKHTGPCPETPACFSARLTARPSARPICRSDGTYAPVQCHEETGYCWCVTPQGRPLPDTSVRNERPRCIKKLGPRSSASTKSGQRRRSPNWKQRRQYSSKHRNTCDRTEKSKFNGNLIENFKIEYRRTNISSDGDKNVERVLSWKFITLDKNSDGYLDRTEYKELRRLAKKAVKPKKCARTFARTCDLNRDLKLSRQEWGACLANDFTLLKGNPPSMHSRPAFNDDPIDTKEDNDANDCLTDRRSVLEDERQHSQEKFYVPACTPDGRYHRVQCYSGYCWCVYQDTGKPIPGTSSKNHTPNCNPVPIPTRPMKGCPEQKKQLFLRDLMDLMHKKMKASGTDSDETTAKWQASKEEQIATWHFVMLDKNKNKVLERKEWKSFRSMVANNRQLQRCGKRLPRYCDINNDRKISMTEWFSCLNAQRTTTSESTEIVSTNKPKRMGPNPLDQFLKNDDD
ncbi:SPARC-related modular calcium-binding protein 1 isoform X3 [Apis mellifera]|uniref:SPARC-related modular calcium-binding protein 1 isoform X3 n=1 Tax=Apis mellifera TaxID=7460 RepID=A0A7M7L817_APIME|nr:SPARC-related modular calcium-binding protein 1 isoform X3 [Apis mellifera]|eukprot:XP_026297390.1 SPARC-related modular calcium-binding protein 1 isoform X3 [Apis mellifera]